MSFDQKQRWYYGICVGLLLITVILAASDFGAAQDAASELRGRYTEFKAEEARKQEEERRRAEEAAITPVIKLSSDTVVLYDSVKMTVQVGGKNTTEGVTVKASDESLVKIRQLENGWEIRGWKPGTVTLQAIYHKGDKTRTAETTLLTNVAIPKWYKGDTAVTRLSMKPGESVSIVLKEKDTTVIPKANGLKVGNYDPDIVRIDKKDKSFTVTALQPGKATISAELYQKPSTLIITVEGLTAWELFDMGYEAYLAGDYKNAVKYYEQSAAYGNLYAMNNLGVCYDWGHGVTQNLQKAFELYKKSADGGDARAMDNVGLFYAYGKGVTQDNSKACEWWRKSADAGDSFGMYHLAECYLYGTYGVKQNREKGLEWLRKAAADEDNTKAAALLRQYE